MKNILIGLMVLLFCSCNKVVSFRDKEPISIPIYPSSIIIRDKPRYNNEIFYEFTSIDDKDVIFEWYINNIPSDWIFYDYRSNNSIKFSKNTECYKFTITVDFIEMVNIVNDTYTVSSTVNNRCK